MKQTRAEVEEELEHQRMMTVIRKRLRVLEIQMAQQGIATPPQIMTEIAAMTEQIKRHETEIARLETLAAENQLSLTEAEYRMMLAEAWSVQDGYLLPLPVATRLEFQRLKLGIPFERASEIEKEVRAKLAEETIYRLSPDIDWFHLNKQKDDPENSPYIFSARAIQVIAKAIIYDNQTVLRLLINVLPPFTPIDFNQLRSLLLKLNPVWSLQQEYEIYEDFLSGFKAVFVGRVVEVT